VNFDDVCGFTRLKVDALDAGEFEVSEGVIKPMYEGIA